MTNNKNTNTSGQRDYVAEFRKQQAEKFISVLQSDGLNWVRHWKGLSPQSGVSGRDYSGMNEFSLRLSKHKDPRWYTFNQITDRDNKVHPGQKWTLRKGSHGEKIEYWFPFDTEDKRPLTWAELDALSKQDDFDRTRYSVRAKHFTVFNAEDIDGVPPYVAPEKPVPHPDRTASDLAAGMGVPVAYDGGDKAYYVPKTDSVHLPDRALFDSPDALAMTTIHELSHATGHESRLNRPNQNAFGTPAYAFEELIAEMAAAFMAPRVQVEVSPVLFENSEAYVQSWIQAIEDKPEALSDAVKAASDAAAYMDAKLQAVREYQQNRDHLAESIVAEAERDADLHQDVQAAINAVLPAYVVHSDDVFDRESLVHVCGADLSEHGFTPGDEIRTRIPFDNALTAEEMGELIADIAILAVTATQAYRDACMEQKASMDDGTLKVTEDLENEINAERSPNRGIERQREDDQ